MIILNNVSHLSQKQKNWVRRKVNPLSVSCFHISRSTANPHVKKEKGYIRDLANPKPSFQ